jgi:hypothetical protein
MEEKDKILEQLNQTIEKICKAFDDSKVTMDKFALAALIQLLPKLAVDIGAEPLEVLALLCRHFREEVARERVEQIINEMAAAVKPQGSC